MDVSDLNLHHFVVYNTSGNESANGVKGKHVGTGTTAAYIQDGVAFNKYYFGISVGGYPNITVSRNYVEQNSSGAGMVIYSTGTGVVANTYQNMVFEYNTVKNAGCFEVIPEDDASQIGTPFATIRKNICIDNRGTAYPSDGTDGFFRIAHYWSDALYADIITGATLTIADNCYYTLPAIIAAQVE